MSYIKNYSDWKQVYEQVAQTETSNPVEKAMIAWWTNPPRDKAELAKKSLDYWNGAGADDKTTRVTDMLINNLTTLSTANTKLDKAKIIALLDHVKKQKAAGVYISTSELDELSALVQNTGTKDIVTFLTAANTPLATSLISAFTTYDTTKLIKLLDDKTKVVVSMTQQDKLDVLDKVTKLASVHAKNTGKTIEEAISKAVTLNLDPVKGTSTTTEIAGPQPNVITHEFSYPDKSKPADSLMQSFFDDNESVPTPEQVEKFNNLVKTAISEVTNTGAKITKIKYYSGGITSKVGTKYLGKGKMDTVFKSENNVPLVNDRIKNLNDILSKAITDNAPAGISIIEGENESAPNTGPGWYEYSTKNSEGESVYTYGPLYEAARKTNSKLTPKEFYAKRSTDSAIKSEYDEVFGKFRGSYGAFTIDTFSKSTEPSDTTKISASGKWRIVIAWKHREPLNFNFKIGVSGGGGKSFSGGDSPTKCWKG